MGDSGKRPFNRLIIVSLFTILTILGVIFSVYFILVANTLYMLLLAICFLVLSLISGFFNVTTAYTYYTSYFYGKFLKKLNKTLKPMTKKPSVAVVVPVYNEDPGMVASNLATLRKINYPKNKMRLYVLDDSTDMQMRAGIERASKRNNAMYIHRDNRKGFKAGALNNFLRYSKEEYIAVFDADEYITDPEFMNDLLPYFQDEKLSFIQTEKRYAKGTFFSDCVDLFDAFFFKFVQPARALHNTALFAGSCGIIRRSALDSVGGFPEYVIEDTFFSFESDIHNYKSLYIPNVYALGKPITKFTDLMRQQWRYNYGDTQFLTYFLHSLRRDNAKKNTFSAISKIDYLSHGMGLNYISVVLVLFTVVSLLTVFSNSPLLATSIRQTLYVSSFQLSTISLELLGMTAFLLAVAIPILLTKIYFKSARKGLMIFVLNFALAFGRFKAAIAAIFNGNPSFGWAKSKGSDISSRILPSIRNSSTEMAFSILLIFSSVVALMGSNLEGAVWLAWYGALYASTLFFFVKYG